MTTAKIKKWAIGISLSSVLLFPNLVQAETYQVKPGDSLWKISQAYGVTITSLKQENALQSDMLRIGQTLKIPSTTSNHQPITHVVQSGESLYIISQRYGVTIDAIKGENQLRSDMILVGQKLMIPKALAAEPVPAETPSPPSGEKSQPYITYIEHTVSTGDNLWALGIRYGIPYQEIADANQLGTNAGLQIGQKLKIPVHHVPVKPVAGPQYGELLDWWTEAQYVWPIGKNAKITDLDTGTSWTMRRTTGAFHADVEPLTAEDTRKMLSVWGGHTSWVTRGVIVEVNGRRIAASATSMPHSVSEIKDNEFPGHSDIHFLNSRRHKDNTIDEKHQEMVRKAAGQ